MAPGREDLTPRQEDVNIYIDRKELFANRHLENYQYIENAEFEWFDCMFPWDHDVEIELIVYMPLALFECKNNCLTEHMRESLIDINEDFKEGVFDTLLTDEDLAELEADLAFCNADNL